MEVDFSDPKSTVETRTKCLGKDQVRVKRETLQLALEQFRRALELLNTTSGVDEDDKDSGVEVKSTGSYEDRCLEDSPSTRDDRDSDELRDLLKSGFECPAFLEKLQCAQASNSRNGTEEEGNSWHMVNENDLWKGEDVELDQESFVLIKREDIAEGMACFVASYLLSLEHTKDLTPSQLQKVLRKTLSVKKKGKLQKTWEGSKVIYNVASWGATAIGIYQNPLIIRAATRAFWTSCKAISKLI